MKKILKETQSDSSNVVSLDHQLLKTINKMKCKEISIIILSKVNTPTSQIFFEKRFLYNFQWKDMYTLLLKVTVNAYLGSSQYKILNVLLVYQTHNYVLFSNGRRE